MPNAPRETPTFEKCLKTLHLTIELASQSHKVWLEVGHFVARNQHFPLTRYLIRSSFLTMIIELFKPLDRNRKSYSFRMLLRLAKRQGGTADKTTCAMVSDMLPLWRKIKLLRHKAYAHLDSGRTIASLLVETGNNAEDFETLLKAYEVCLMHIYRTQGLRFTPLQEANDLLDADLSTTTKSLATAAGYPYSWYK